eukprot:10939932-Ditylum_brightwellii.AAC.1
MARAQMNPSWYDAHMKMKRKCKELDLEKHNPTTNDDEEDIDIIIQLMGMSDAPNLWNRLFAMQQELYAYHSFLDEIERLKEHNSQLEREATYLFQECSLHKKKLKENALSTVQSLKDVIIGLKMELAQSKQKEHLHEAEIESVCNDNKTLERETRVLRE